MEGLHVARSITMLYHYAECHYTECRILFIAMLSVIMLNVIMLNVVMLNVVMLNVVMLNVVAPAKEIAVNKVLVLYNFFLSSQTPNKIS